MSRFTLGLAIFLSGCTAAMMGPPTYTQDELRQQCMRQGGWWRPEGPTGGLCEIEAPGFM